MKAKILLAVTVATAVLIALTWRAAHQNTPANEALTAAAGQRVELLEKLHRVELRVQTAKAALAAVEEKWQAANIEAEASKAKPESAEKSSGAVSERKVTPYAIVANTPQLMAEYAKNVRGGLDWQYGGLFKALHLSPQQIEQFKDLELSLHEAWLDLEAAAELHRLDRDSVEYKKLYKDYERLRHDKKAALLGDLMEPYLQHYHTGTVRSYAKQLAWTGIYTGENVRAEQVERATDILAANSKHRSGPGVEPNTVNWPVARTQLSGVLSPSQIETLGLFVERDAKRSEMNDQVKRLTEQFKKQSGMK